MSDPTKKPPVIPDRPVMRVVHWADFSKYVPGFARALMALCLAPPIGGRRLTPNREEVTCPKCQELLPTVPPDANQQDVDFKIGGLTKGGSIKDLFGTDKGKKAKKKGGRK